MRNLNPVLNVDINLLRTFLEISKTRHFGKAAENLYLTQAAISARVRLLEEILGTPLFERYRNNIQLTKQGVKLIPYATEMVDIWVRTTQDIRVPQNYQDITIAAPESLWSSKLKALPNKLFKSNSELHLVVESLDSSVIATRLLNRTLDIGFLFDKPKIDELIVANTFELSLLLYANSENLTINDINDTNFVSIDLGLSFQQIQSKILPHVPSPIFQAANWQMAVDYTIEFGGISLLPSSLAAKKKKLFPLINSPQIKRKIYLCHIKTTNLDSDRKNYIQPILQLIEDSYSSK